MYVVVVLQKNSVVQHQLCHKDILLFLNVFYTLDGLILVISQSAMGGSQSSTASSFGNQKLNELLFDRGDDALSVEVHSAEHNEDQVAVFSYFSDSKHKSAVDDCIQVSCYAYMVHLLLLA